MKRVWNIILVTFSILIFSGCRGNEEVAEKTSEDKLSSVEENISEKTLFDVFSISNKEKDVWFIVDAETDGSINPESPVTSFLLTNKSYEDIVGLSDDVIDNKNENGFIFVNAVPDIKEGKVASFEDVYIEYKNNTLEQKIYNSYLDKNKSMGEMWNEGWGESLFPKYAEEVRFTLGVDTDSKIGFESFQFYGKDNRYSKNSSRYGYFSFRATEDNMILPIPADDNDKEPELYLVGVKGYHSESNNKPKYFLKFSDKKEKIIMDILYSHDEIQNVKISD